MVNLRNSTALGLLCGVAMLALHAARPAGGQDWNESLTHHPWVSFNVGAWKSVRVRTDSFDNDGNVTNTTETLSKTKLTQATAKGYTLQVQVNVEAAGKVFPQQTTYVEKTFGTQVTSDTKLREEVLSINGSEWPTEVRQIVVEAPRLRRISTVHFVKQPVSSGPAAVKWTTVALDPQNDQLQSQLDVQVTAVDGTYRVLGENVSSWNVTITQKQGKTTTTTREVHCASVPGGLVARETEDRDEQTGKLIRRSTLEVVGYGYGEPVRARSRWRARHHRRAATSLSQDGVPATVGLLP